MLQIIKTKVAFPLRHACYASISAALLLGGIETASAFSAADSTLALDSYNQQFYFLLSNGQGYYRTEYGSGNTTSFWQSAEQIELAVDSKNTTMVNQLCAGFIAKNGTDWSGNSYNDDLSWASMAFSRAYMLTGNTNYKTYAKNGFDTAYNRGWDTVNGGMWWNTSKTSKPSCANGPGGIAAYLIYLNYGDSSYEAKAQAYHTWEINNVYDSSTGSVKGSPTGTDYNTYDSGTFAGTAYYLGDTTRGLAAAGWVQSHWGPAANWPTFGFGSDAGGFAGICFRWMAKAGYLNAYFQSVVDGAWALRDSENLVCCSWNAQTPDLTDPLYSWDCSDVVVGMLCQQPEVYEPDALTVASYSGPDYRTVADSNFRDGDGVILDSTAVGNYICFVVPNIAAATYDVKVSVKKLNTRGIFQLAIGPAGSNSPTNVAAPQDLYAATTEYEVIDLGTWTPVSTSDKWFWFTITGKNSASTGYSECFDYISLTPQ